MVGCSGIDYPISYCYLSHKGLGCTCHISHCFLWRILVEQFHDLIILICYDLRWPLPVPFSYCIWYLSTSIINTCKVWIMILNLNIVRCVCVSFLLVLEVLRITNYLIASLFCMTFHVTKVTSYIPVFLWFLIALVISSFTS